MTIFPKDASTRSSAKGNKSNNSRCRWNRTLGSLWQWRIKGTIWQRYASTNTSGPPILVFSVHLSQTMGCTDGTWLAWRFPWAFRTRDASPTPSDVQGNPRPLPRRLLRYKGAAINISDYTYKVHFSCRATCGPRQFACPTLCKWLHQLLSNNRFATETGRSWCVRLQSHTC